MTFKSSNTEWLEKADTDKVIETVRCAMEMGCISPAHVYDALDELMCRLAKAEGKTYVAPSEGRVTTPIENEGMEVTEERATELYEKYKDAYKEGEVIAMRVPLADVRDMFKCTGALSALLRNRTLKDIAEDVGKPKNYEYRIRYFHNGKTTGWSNDTYKTYEEAKGHVHLNKGENFSIYRRKATDWEYCES